MTENNTAQANNNAQQAQQTVYQLSMNWFTDQLVHMMNIGELIKTLQTNSMKQQQVIRQLSEDVKLLQEENKKIYDANRTLINEKNAATPNVQND